LIKPGQILFTIYSRNQTNEPHRLVSASVGVAQPKDTSKYGYLSEYESFGKDERKTGDYAEDIAAQMLEFHLILIRAGTKNVSNGQFLDKYTRQKILLKPQREIKMENGQLFLLLQF
jgi:pyruvoyl-dependent arginine decarboxylase